MNFYLLSFIEEMYFTLNMHALSYYEYETDTRFGDCILLYGGSALVVYDCGHSRHAESVGSFLQLNPTITDVSIVVSHNDGDHTDGVRDLLAWLYDNSKYSVRVYTHQYLKHIDTILEKIDDGRRNRESLKKSLLAEFDNIKEIIETAQIYGFPTIEALSGIAVGGCTIVGPTVDEFTDVAAKAVDSRESNSIGEGHAEETVMNAASVQLQCTLDNNQSILLCGDASPDYLHNLNNYYFIQLPHHGQKDDAIAIFEALGGNSYSKGYLISDNTGTGKSSGGSDDLVQYMKDEKYSDAYNTKNGIVVLPISSATMHSNQRGRGYLGDLDSIKAGIRF